jgi:hypothetical protein
MMALYKFLLFVCCTSFVTVIRAQAPIPIKAVANSSVQFEGELSTGQPIADLNWAWDSQNACFVSTQQHKFSGHHVLFKTELPRRAELFIKVIPKDMRANFSLYAYSGGGGHLPPALPYCTSCEADYKWDFKYAGKTQDHTREVSLRAVNNPLPVTIGVVGAEGLKTGAFTLELRMDGGAVEQTAEQQPLPRFQLPQLSTEIQRFSGNLNEGSICHDLSWAWNSQNACFVAPRKHLFSGHHVLYLAEIPAQSEVEISLSPTDKSRNMSLYAYTLSSEYQFVPELNSCISCEASFQSSYKKEQNNERSVQLRTGGKPYRLVIGVAGAEQLKEGAFTLSVVTKNR